MRKQLRKGSRTAKVKRMERKKLKRAMARKQAHRAKSAKLWAESDRKAFEDARRARREAKRADAERRTQHARSVSASKVFENRRKNLEAIVNFWDVTR